MILDRDRWYSKDVQGLCIKIEKSYIYKVGAARAHNQTKTTMVLWFKTTPKCGKTQPSADYEVHIFGIRIKY